MDAVTETGRSPVEEFLREFDRRWLKPRTFSDNLGAAVDYLRTGPTFRGLVPPAVATVLEEMTTQLHHVGFCVRGVPRAHVEGVLSAAGFTDQLVFPSALSPRRTIVSAHHPDLVSVEVALDDETVDPPHIAWLLKDEEALLDIGAALEGTLFSPPDFMKNMIAFNRDQRVMFRYFEGQIASHRIRLEFCL